MELCLRLQNVKYFTVPKRTYISVPFLASKLNIDFDWRDEDWQDFYYLGKTNIIDAAVLWKNNSYISGSLMVISFQFKKHLSLGKGGIILTDNKEIADKLKKMSYDGRIPNIPWRNQDISTVGYHYYMTPETAALGLKKLKTAIKTQPKKWSISDWPDLSKLKVFEEKNKKREA